MSELHTPSIGEEWLTDNGRDPAKVVKIYKAGRVRLDGSDAQWRVGVANIPGIGMTPVLFACGSYTGRAALATDATRALHKQAWERRDALLAARQKVREDLRKLEDRKQALSRWLWRRDASDEVLLSEYESLSEGATS